MQYHNDGNDDRRWKAHSRRRGKAPVTYDTIADIDLIARNTGEKSEAHHRFADVEGCSVKALKRNQRRSGEVSSRNVESAAEERFCDDKAHAVFWSS